MRSFGQRTSAQFYDENSLCVHAFFHIQHFCHVVKSLFAAAMNYNIKIGALKHHDGEKKAKK